MIKYVNVVKLRNKIIFFKFMIAIFILIKKAN